eukprot:CAMPEP_0206496524 /NCGR_PEP_ID=MMETSP0324_2-20121206/49478_1 /ASSEMBLY_ACC=CAM_ASM_000836 /TAXON_ID=2866 /ORGANISM="Crypthecodinium cohnii, Strain Seligo" /LENGTH=42 /DNA_ID= /DNA_START= /DNA_END= /DNA_ORIENTATION=
MTQPIHAPRHARGCGVEHSEGQVKFFGERRGGPERVRELTAV